MPIWKQLRKLTLALGLGGIVGAVFAVSPTLVVIFTPAGGLREYRFVPQNISYALIACLLTIPASIVIGLPSFFLFRYLRILNWGTVILAGVAGGVVIGALIKGRVPSVGECAYYTGIGLTASATAFGYYLRLIK